MQEDLWAPDAVSEPALASLVADDDELVGVQAWQEHFGQVINDMAAVLEACCGSGRGGGGGGGRAAAGGGGHKHARGAVPGGCGGACGAESSDAGADAAWQDSAGAAAVPAVPASGGHEVESGEEAGWVAGRRQELWVGAWGALRPYLEDNGMHATLRMMSEMVGASAGL